MITSQSKNIGLQHYVCWVNVFLCIIITILLNFHMGITYIFLFVYNY